MRNTCAVTYCLPTKPACDEKPSYILRGLQIPILGTSGLQIRWDGSVTNLYNEKYNKMNCVFMMHSHCWPDGTKGASKLLIGNTWGKCDMASITSDYNFYERQGMKNINVWFKYQDTYTVFPKHYVYDKYSNNLYFYDVWVNNYFIRKINKANDFYRNLGF